MNQLERRLALLEIRQPPGSQYALVAGKWLREWEETAPRLAATYHTLRWAEENGATLEPLDASLLAHLSAIALDGDVTAAVRLIVQELAAVG